MEEPVADVETGDVLRIAAVMEFDAAETIVNTWHVKVMSGGGLAYPAASGDVAEYVDDLYTFLTTYLTDLQLPEHLELSNPTQGTTYGSFSWDTWAGGTNVNDPTATQVCHLGFARTYLPRVQIRKYLGVFTEDHMTESLWSSTQHVAVSNLMAHHITAQTLTAGLVLKGVAYNQALGRATEAISPASTRRPVIQRRRRLDTGA